MFAYFKLYFDSMSVWMSSFLDSLVVWSQMGFGDFVFEFYCRFCALKVCYLCVFLLLEKFESSVYTILWNFKRLV